MAEDPARNRRRRAQPDHSEVTVDALERAAHDYLARFATSVEQLRRALMRRVNQAQRRDQDAQTTDGRPVAGSDAVDAIIDRLSELGILNDQRFAEARALTLHRRGLPASTIRIKLREKGVAANTVEAALEALHRDLSLEPAASDLAAAIRLAQRRRLGPFRASDLRPERRHRDLAALDRAGFDFDTACRVIDAATADELSEMIATERSAGGRG